MSIAKLGKWDSGFELIPRSTLQDAALTIDELGSLVRLLSLPGNWQLRMDDVEKRLGIGRDKRRAIFARLIELKYVTRKRTHKASRECA